MVRFLNQRYVKTVIREQFLIVCALFCGSQGVLMGIHNGAFVIPLVSKEGKTYVMLGREARGKDKGLYCAPGGSAGFWLFKDTDPVATAAREFCEETLVSIQYETVYNLIATSYEELITVRSENKQVLGYTLLLPRAIIEDIIHNFSARQAATWFWEYYHHEMENFGLVEWDAVLEAVTQSEKSGYGCSVEGLMYDPSTGIYYKKTMQLRPIFVFLCKEYQKSTKKRTI